MNFKPLILIVCFLLVSCTSYRISTTGFPIVALEDPGDESSDAYLGRLLGCLSVEAKAKDYQGPFLVEAEGSILSTIYLKPATRKEFEAFGYLSIGEATGAFSRALAGKPMGVDSDERKLRFDIPQGVYKLLEFQTLYSSDIRTIAQMSLAQIDSTGHIQLAYGINSAGNIRNELGQALGRVKHCQER